MGPSGFNRLRLIWALSAALAVGALIPIAAGRIHPAPPPLTAVPPPAPAVAALPQYSVAVGLEGEIFPVFANYDSLQKPAARRMPTVAVTVTNTTRALLRNRVVVQLPGWSDPEIQPLELAPGESRTLKFAPVFHERFYRNHEIVAATAVVSAIELPSGRTGFSTTIPARLRAADDLYWGSHFQYAKFIASWVTPHDPEVEQVLSLAKESMPGRRMPGYETWKNSAAQVHETYLQAEAIYGALRRKGVSYVKSSSTLGGHQGVSERIRLPHESLRQVSANCIDGVVMYASLFENLGMDAQVVLVPGHAYVAVREAQNSDRFLYVETALTGRSSFADAVLAASRGMQKWQESQVIRIPISQAREQGIYPLPVQAQVRLAAAMD